MSYPNAHDYFIDWLTKEYNLTNNHILIGNKQTKIAITGITNTGVKEQHIIPDLIGNDVLVEAEVIGDKSKYYYYVEQKKRALFLGIRGFDAFDEIYLFSIDKARPPFTKNNLPWTYDVSKRTLNIKELEKLQANK